MVPQHSFPESSIAAPLHRWSSTNPTLSIYDNPILKKIYGTTEAAIVAKSDHWIIHWCSILSLNHCKYFFLFCHSIFDDIFSGDYEAFICIPWCHLRTITSTLSSDVKHLTIRYTDTHHCANAAGIKKIMSWWKSSADKFLIIAQYLPPHYTPPLNLLCHIPWFHTNYTITFSGTSFSVSIILYIDVTYFLSHYPFVHHIFYIIIHHRSSYTTTLSSVLKYFLLYYMLPQHSLCQILFHWILRLHTIIWLNLPKDTTNVSAIEPP